MGKEGLGETAGGGFFMTGSDLTTGLGFETFLTTFFGLGFGFGLGLGFGFGLGLGLGFDLGFSLGGSGRFTGRGGCCLARRILMAAGLGVAFLTEGLIWV